MFNSIGRGKLHEHVVASITELIVNGSLPRGAELPAEPELCEQFGVSRTVVRDAMKILQGRGLVEVTQGRGTIVSSNLAEASSNMLTIALRQQQATLLEVWEVRRILEVGIAGLAAERAAKEDIAAMEQVLGLMRNKLNEPVGYVDADVEFHNLLADATHNDVFESVLRPIAQLLRYSREMSFRGPERVKRTLAAHEAIWDAVAAGDPDEAREAMRQHLDQTAQDLKEALGETAMWQPIAFRSPTTK